MHTLHATRDGKYFIFHGSKRDMVSKAGEYDTAEVRNQSGEAVYCLAVTPIMILKQA